MPLADHIPSPTFVQGVAAPSGGLDLLGLRLPVQATGGTLLNGVTTITPMVRYLSLRTWLLYRYVNAEPAPEDRFKAFEEYASRAEAAFALGNLMRDPSAVGLIGARKAAQKIEEGGDVLVLEPLTKQLAVNIYGNPSDQLRLTGPGKAEIPVIGQEHGEPLVLAVEKTMGATAIGERLRSAEPMELAAWADLEEFGQAAFVDQIPDFERDALIAAILPDDPVEDERRRIATFAVLLALADHVPDDQALDEGHLFDEAVRPDRDVPVQLHDILDGWLLYAVRDAVAVTGEHTFAVIVRKLLALDPDGAGVGASLLVRRLIEDSIDEQESALREVGLLDAGDNLAALTYRELEARLSERTRELSLYRGIRRWSGPITETTVYRAAPGVEDGAVALGVLSWMMAERRVGIALETNAARGGEDLELIPGLRVLAAPGTARFGLPDVVIPRLEDWRARNLPAPAVLSEFAHLVIDQHLRTAWSRLAQDPNRDVSVIVRDGDRLIRVSDYWGGRAASRLFQAIGWLEQLNLLRDGRTTDEGRAVLTRILGVLS